MTIMEVSTEIIDDTRSKIKNYPSTPPFTANHDQSSDKILSSLLNSSPLRSQSHPALKKLSSEAVGKPSQSLLVNPTDFSSSADHAPSMTRPPLSNMPND